MVYQQVTRAVPMKCDECNADIPRGDVAYQYDAVLLLFGIDDTLCASCMDVARKAGTVETGRTERVITRCNALQRRENARKARGYRR